MVRPVLLLPIFALGLVLISTVTTFCPAKTRVTAFTAISTIVADALVAFICRTGLHLTTSTVRAPINGAVLHVAHLLEVSLLVAGAVSAENALAVRAELESLHFLDTPADRVTAMFPRAEGFDAEPVRRVPQLSLAAVDAGN